MGNFEERFLSDKIFIRQDFYQTRFLSDKISIREDGCLSDFSFAGAADLDSPTQHLQASSWRAAQRDDNTSTQKFVPFPSNFHSTGISSMESMLLGGMGMLLGRSFLDQVVFAFGPRLAFHLTHNHTKNKNHNQLAYK